MAELGDTPLAGDINQSPAGSIERSEGRIHRLGAFVEKIVLDKIFMPHHTREARKEAKHDR